MKIYIDCLPCMLLQVVETSRLATNNTLLQDKIMYDAVQILSKYKEYSKSPTMWQDMQDIIKGHTGVADPYACIKAQDLSKALEIEPFINNYASRVNDSTIRLLKISATGNIMDSAMYSELNIDDCLIDEMERSFVICDENKFIKDLETAKKILIIGDNVGEVIFDKVMIQYLFAEHEVIYAVRDKPTLNDATIDDTLKTGMADHALIISTGCGAPGAVLESCSKEFREIFYNADIVISKGLGNYEALSDPPRRIYFSLKAKCPKIAIELGVGINDYVFKASGRDN